MNFKEVAHYFNLLEKTSGRLAMTHVLADLFSKSSESDIEIIVNLTMGQLHPVYEETQFGLAEKTVTAFVAHFLGYETSVIATKAKKEGDLGAVIAEYSWNCSAELSVAQVYTKLCHLEQERGTGSQERRAQILQELLRDLDPVSAKYVVRIIIGKLRLGFSDMTIIDALSWMLSGDKSLRDRIESAYNKSADLGLLAAKLKKQGITAVDAISITVGIPILPAAAERLSTAHAIVKKLGPCVAQLKLDGFRLQIHVDKTKKVPQIHFYSRNLHNMSDIFPELRDAVLELDVKQIVAEGEAIGFDPNTGVFLPFQETVKRKRKHGVEAAAQEYPLKLFLFDLLYLDGVNMMEYSHEDRRKKLEKIICSVSNDSLHLIEEKHIYTDKELEHYFSSAIAQGLEGLVVKRPDAIYQPGKRNFNWIKLKRQEEGHLEDTLDCVILGYYAGKGKRASFGIGAFLVGLYNKKEDKFETVAKIGTGMTDDEWRSLKKQCDAILVPNKPKNVECPKELYPDIWVSPEIICQIRADEITRSPLHTAGKTDLNNGYALRFPRFMGYRPDKGPFDATTTNEIVHLFDDQYVSIAKSD